MRPGKNAVYDWMAFMRRQEGAHRLERAIAARQELKGLAAAALDARTADAYMALANDAILSGDPDKAAKIVAAAVRINAASLRLQEQRQQAERLDLWRQSLALQRGFHALGIVGEPHAQGDPAPLGRPASLCGRGGGHRRREPRRLAGPPRRLHGGAPLRRGDDPQVVALLPLWAVGRVTLHIGAQVMPGKRVGDQCTLGVGAVLLTPPPPPPPRPPPKI